jgi:hypothetical protein
MRLRPTLVAIALSICLVPTAFAVVGREGQDDAVRLREGARFPAVGQVLPDGGCTLVAPRWALTAAHVAAGMKPGSRVRFDGAEAIVKRVVLHPQGVAPRGQPPEVDLALVEFESDVAGIKPMPLYRGHEELAKTLWLVGYGDFGNAGGPLAHSDGQRRAVANAVDDAGPKRLFLRFDAPPAGVAMEGVGGPGDSGGAAVLESKDAQFIAGVSSASMDGKPGTYGVTDVYTRVGSFVAWIDEVIAGKR